MTTTPITAQIVPQPATDQAPAAGTTQRQEFGGTAIVKGGETAMSAQAERARALVEARFIMAL